LAVAKHAARRHVSIPRGTTASSRARRPSWDWVYSVAQSRGRRRRLPTRPRRDQAFVPSPADTCLLVRDSRNHVTCNTDQVRGQMSGGRCPRGLSVLNSCLSPSSALQTTVSVEVSRRQMVDARRSRATLHCCRLLIEILMRLLSVRCVLIAQSWPPRTRRA